MGKKKAFEVRVEGVAVEFYQVFAEDEAEAIEKWASGELTGGDGYDFHPVSATEDTFYDEDDDYDPED